MRRADTRPDGSCLFRTVLTGVLEPASEKILAWFHRLARLAAVALVLHFLVPFMECCLHPVVETTYYDSRGRVEARSIRQTSRRDEWDKPEVYISAAWSYLDWTFAGSGSLTRYLDVDSTFPSVLGSLLLMMVVWSLPRYRGRQDLSFLETLDDVRDLPEVIPLARSSDPELHAAASTTLCRLLTRLPGMGTGMLSAEDQAGLCSLLRWERAREDLPLMRAILQALQQAGDSRAIPAVTRLAWRTPGDNDEERLQAAARQCLPILEARATEEQNARMLLRPSEQPPSALLRPSEPLPDTLLRPVSVEGTEE